MSDTQTFPKLRTVRTTLSQDTAKLMVEAHQIMRLYDTTQLTNLILYCHAAAVASGWWHDPKTGEPLELNVGERIALSHSELSEALEGARKGLPSDHLPGVSMFEEEIADTFIRLGDLLGGTGMEHSIVHTILRKVKYNLERADHKPENRLKEGGKEF
jgi:hypothetical protein